MSSESSQLAHPLPSHNTGGGGGEGGREGGRERSVLKYSFVATVYSGYYSSGKNFITSSSQGKT